MVNERTEKGRLRDVDELEWHQISLIVVLKAPVERLNRIEPRVSLNEVVLSSPPVMVVAVEMHSDET